MSLFWLSMGWILAACLLGFFISAVFAGQLGFSRRVFLIPYLGGVLVFLYAYAAWSGYDLQSLFLANWPVGILAGLTVGALLVQNVRSQPASRQSQGSNLAFDLGWLGFAYGIVDGLYLNVMPVLAIWLAFGQMEWAASFWGKISVAALGLVASMLVTLIYHVGYPEFRNKSVWMVVLGNALITLAYLLSGSPLGAVLGHTIMHLAAVLRGPETTLQLPPHYTW